MPLIPLKLPPGVYRNGTRYQAKGRWHNAERVRWRDGVMKPIGGWERKPNASGGYADDLTTSGEFVRDGIAWRDNTKLQYVVWGSNEAIYWQKADGTNEDITPAAVASDPGSAHPGVASGYGTGLYGTGPYGLDPANPDPSAYDVARWKFDTWGENLLALPDWHGVLYEWAPVTATNAVAVANAPTDIIDFIVTDERIVMTLGAADELRLVSWSDQEDNTDWTPSTTNQAGTYVVPGHGRLIGVYKLRGQYLILTETDAWITRYIGPPYVYAFEKVGEGCAPVHRKAVTVLPNGTAVWLGHETFWSFAGAVEPLPCDLIDFLNADLDRNNVSKIFGWANSKHREMWLHYPSVRSDAVTDPGVTPVGIECGYYVSWNWETGAWSQGTLPRSAMIADGVYDDPQGTGWYGWSYWHERSGVAFGDDIGASAETGPIEAGDGEYNIAIRAIYPDAQRGNWDGGTVYPGSVNFQFESRQMPTGAARLSAEYTYVSDSNQPIPVMVLGRDVMLKVFTDSSSDNGWEWGDMRLDIQTQGTGKR